MLSNEILKKRYKIASGIITAASLLLVAAVFFYRPGSNQYRNNKVSTGEVAKQNTQMATANTVRLYGKDIYETACAITQAAYTAVTSSSKPNAVILVRDDRKLDGILAARLSRMPVNAPVLYAAQDNIPETIWKEIQRLDPQGVTQDRNIRIILVGDMSQKVKDKIKSHGWKYRSIDGTTPFELGKNIDDYVATLTGNHSDTVFIASTEQPEAALVQMAWNAQSGDAFFFINKDSVTQEVVHALKSRYGGAYIYILGDSVGISQKVYKTLSACGHVQKIPQGQDIFSQSSTFASFHDIGKNFGWWVSKKNREVGWGITEEGHNFILLNPQDWHSAVTASVLSRKGRYAPMLLVQKDNIPEAVKSYLKTVRPSYTTIQNQLYNQGWIIGNTEYISEEIQGQLDSLLESEVNSSNAEH